MIFNFYYDLLFITLIRYSLNKLKLFIPNFFPELNAEDDSKYCIIFLKKQKSYDLSNITFNFLVMFSNNKIYNPYSGNSLLSNFKIFL